MQEVTPKGTRIAHVGIALASLGDLAPFLGSVLGLSEVEINDSDGARISAFEAGESLVELLESSDSSSPIGKFVAKKGPGIHHICFSVEDLEGTLARCSAAGIEVIDTVPRIGAEGKKIAFLHPRSTGGILIELTER
jgi:methylmalonyl-CoA/ethylmalonyl-CoA epimerase